MTNTLNFGSNPEITTESKFTAGMLVEHPAYGIGRIIKIIPPILHVYFKSQEEPIAKKFALPKNILKVAEIQQDETMVQTGLFIEKNGTYFLAPKKSRRVKN